ncbi:hypothetical protein FHX14_000636 [Rhizobium sp. BK619]|nr:hypothetical protein [Rhizobium sp. BK619]
MTAEVGLEEKDIFSVTSSRRHPAEQNRSGDPEPSLRIYRSPPRRQKSPHLQRLLAASPQRCFLIIVRNSPNVWNPMCRTSRWTVVGETRQRRATAAALSNAVMSGLSIISLATRSRLTGNIKRRLAIRRFSSCSVAGGGDFRSFSIASTFERAAFTQSQSKSAQRQRLTKMHEMKSDAFSSLDRLRLEVARCDRHHALQKSNGLLQPF